MHSFTHSPQFISYSKQARTERVCCSCEMHNAQHERLYRISNCAPLCRGVLPSDGADNAQIFLRCSSSDVLRWAHSRTHSSTHSLTTHSLISSHSVHSLTQLLSTITPVPALAPEPAPVPASAPAAAATAASTTHQQQQQQSCGSLRGCGGVGDHG